MCYSFWSLEVDGDSCAAVSYSGRTSMHPPMPILSSDGTSNPSYINGEDCILFFGKIKQKNGLKSPFLLVPEGRVLPFFVASAHYELLAAT